MPPGIGADTTPLGTARVRGRNGAGTFDRRDRLSVVADVEAPAVVLDMTGTIRGGTETVGDPRYQAEAVRLVTHFETDVAASGPAAGERETVSIRDRSDPTEHAVDHTYTARTDAARRGFTGCQRVLLTPDRLPEPLTYTANGRFTWRDPRLLGGDEPYHHHTPGRAVWRA